MGYSIIVVSDVKIEMLDMNVLKLGSSINNYKRLQLIYLKVRELITHFNPDCFAIEAPFFGKNVQSMLKLGRAQGVAIAAAISTGVEVFEYSPKKIKQSITGNGNAHKEQVWKMLQHLMIIKEKDIKYLDASDALAVAVCHHFQYRSIGKTEKKGGWKEFILQNPHLIKTR